MQEIFNNINKDANLFFKQADKFIIKNKTKNKLKTLTF